MVDDTLHKCSNPQHIHPHLNQVLAINCCADCDPLFSPLPKLPSSPSITTLTPLPSSLIIPHSASSYKTQTRYTKQKKIPSFPISYPKMPDIELRLKLKATTVAALLVLLLLAMPALSRGRLNVKKNKKSNMGSEVYEIDYRGPETHTYIPPPNRAGDRPRIHHKASMARRQKPKLNKARRNL